MEIDIWELALIFEIPSIIMSILVWSWKKKIDKNEKKKAEIDQARFENEIYRTKATNASLALGIVAAKALKEGHTNGLVDNALDEAKHVQQEYEEFLSKQGIKALY